MKKITYFFLKNPRITKIIGISLFTCFFIFSLKTITSSISESFKVHPLIFVFLIIGWLVREGMIYLFNKKIKSLFPTTYLPDKIGKAFDKFFNLGIILSLLALGINPIIMFIQMQPIIEIQVKNIFLGLSLWVFIIYAVAIVITSGFYYYKDEFKKIKNVANSKENQLNIF
jgi:hypothetical protein